jgi:hypothetical protein
LEASQFPGKGKAHELAACNNCTSFTSISISHFHQQNYYSFGV